MQADPNFWMQCDSVLRLSKNWNTKFMCLLAVEDNVKVGSPLRQTKWQIIGAQQREVIKQYIVGLVMKITENPEVIKQQRNILGKCNSIIVHVGARLKSRLLNRNGTLPGRLR